ncbi:MAG: LapA family protein [Burkholderiaceae bacterium]
MQRLAWLLKLLLQAVCFFVLFAFALNNQHDVTVNFFFGTHWRGPLVLLVLAVFAGGVLLGAVGLMPRWWRKRQSLAVESSAAPNLTADRPAQQLQTEADLAPLAVAAPVTTRPVRPHGS